MIRTSFFFICFAFSLVITGALLPVWHILGWLGLKDAQKSYGYYVSSNWAKFLLTAAGVRATVKGIDNIPREGAVLFVSNHQGNFDIPVLFSCLNKPIGFLAKIELAKIPVIKSWMPKLGCVFIDRANLRQSIKAIQNSVEVLKGGQSMVIFPEGTRAKGPQMGEFKKGSLRLVEKVGVPIVPITVSGTYKAMEANEYRIKPAKVTVTVSQPIYFDRLSKEGQGDINSIVREAIEKNLR